MNKPLCNQGCGRKIRPYLSGLPTCWLCREGRLPRSPVTCVRCGASYFSRGVESDRCWRCRKRAGDITSPALKRPDEVVWSKTFLSTPERLARIEALTDRADRQEALFDGPRKRERQGRMVYETFARREES